MNKRQKKKRIRLKNKKLVAEFPFLLPKNSWTGKVYESYNYDFTLLDDMPCGWKRTFGIELCKDLKAALLKANYLKDYLVVQVKEKFGTLRWYDNGNTEEGHRVISNYEYVSGHTCIRCGKLNTPMIDDGWLSPVCENCYNKYNECYKRMGSERKFRAYKDVVCDDTPLSSSYKETRFSNEGKVITEHDISDILRRIKK